MVRRVHTDEGTEFFREIDALCRKGVEKKITTPHTPQYNELAERMH